MGKIGVFFSGQGSQVIGMYTDIYNNSTVREIYKRASEKLGYDLYLLCCNSDKETLSNILYSSPAIFVGGYAMYHYLFDNADIRPNIMAGHSLGEYLALTCAGYFSFSTGLDLIMYRAKLADEIRRNTNSSMMVVTNLNYFEVDYICRGMRKNGNEVYISCYNSTLQLSVVGRESDLKALEYIVVRKGGRCTYLYGNAPYHSPFMNDMSEKLKNYISEIQINSGNCAVVSNWNMKLYHKENIIDTLVNQLINPVMWIDVVKKCIRQNVNDFVEIGSKQILKKMIKSSNIDVNICNYKDYIQNIIL